MLRIDLVKMMSVLVVMSLALFGNVQPSPAASPEPLAVEHVTVIDGTGRAAQAGMTIVISGGRISAVGPDGSVAVPRAARRIDAGGQYLIPGMMDLHLHLMGGGVV